MPRRRPVAEGTDERGPASAPSSVGWHELAIIGIVCALLAIFALVVPSARTACSMLAGAVAVIVARLWLLRLFPDADTGTSIVPFAKTRALVRSRT